MAIAQKSTFSKITQILSLMHECLQSESYSSIGEALKSNKRFWNKVIDSLHTTQSCSLVTMSKQIAFFSSFLQSDEAKKTLEKDLSMSLMGSQKVSIDLIA